MGQIVATFADLPASRQVVTLGGVQYQLRLTWRDRTASWYADLWSATGTPIMLGQRLSPGWAVGLGLTPAGKPDGVLLVRGPSDYDRGTLGGAMRLVFYPTSELPASSEDDDGLTVTVP
jgi:hypothetical protein